MKNIDFEKNTIFSRGTFALLAAVVLMVTFLAGYGTCIVQRCSQPDEFTLLSQAHGILRENFYGIAPDKTQFEYGMIRGMLSELEDPYTTFNEPGAAELDADRRSGAFGGIGAHINKNSNGQFILTPLENYPAIRAGILTNDQLLSVDGNSISTETTIEEVIWQIRGEIGTSVNLTIRTGTEAPRKLSISRIEIEIPSVSWHQMEQDTTIGVVDIERFSHNTENEAEEAVKALVKSGVTRLILDLRGNGGGLLESSVSVANLFLEDGVIMYQASRGEKEESFHASSKEVAKDIPLVVLVDNYSASAAEIVAAALQEHDRAVLIGQQTFGKGSVQLIFNLADDSSLHVTSANWFTANRTAIESKGITPDILIETNGQSAENDLTLNRAVSFLNNSANENRHRSK
ncbi:MAG: S41 family peptidase [Anaerolineales bacterium]|nr:S41 family peptidase [Anaerolineales bacterium]